MESKTPVQVSYTREIAGTQALFVVLLKYFRLKIMHIAFSTFTISRKNL